MSTIKAVTFDLWDTLVHDDSDEPKRRQLGLRSKRDERRHLVWSELEAIEPIEFECVSRACDVADAAFHIAWKEDAVTWRLEQRLRVVLDGLGRPLPQAALDRLVERIGALEVEVPPAPIDRVGEALAQLSRRYRLAIVSDAIVTPGTGLRRLLARHGLAQHFEAFAFSDEVGRSKPHRAMFEHTATALGVTPKEIVHIGDRDHNDVQGPHALGAKAILFTATHDRDRASTTADGICDHARDLPGLIEQLAGTPTEAEHGH
jgi:putative hydrolase of the HAD superfamily